MAPAVGERERPRTTVALLLALAALRVGCAVVEPEPASEHVAAYLRAIGPAVIVPEAEEAAAELGALHGALDALVAAGGGAGPPLDEARLAFASAMESVERLELMQLGPGASSLVDADGLDLRDRIYAWPEVNPCRIDQELVRGDFGSETWWSAALPPFRSLSAVEAILFEDGTDNRCATQVDINADGSWDALGEAEVRLRRARYALVLVGDSRDAATELAAAWRDGYSTEFAEKDGPVALETVLRALLYLDGTTKDTKLGIPLGILSCTGCATDPESPWADLSVPHLRNNLRGARTLYLGGSSGGFDTLLREEGFDDVADRVIAAFDAADAAAVAAPPSFLTAMDSDPAPLIALHSAIKGVTDLLKADLPTALALRLPEESAGDAD